jgi:hypothetical protein
MGDLVQSAIDLGRTLVTPALVYSELEILALSADSVRLSLDGEREPRVLRIGPHADLLASAAHLLVAVCTIGPALELRVQQLTGEGETLLAYWLDTVGVLTLGAVGETLRCIAQEKATERGWGVSAALSPGSLVGWPLQGQRELCALLPLASIGVRLNKHCVLEPHKSSSTVIGLGAGYESHQVGSVCHFCSLAETCWRRH